VRFLIIRCSNQRKVASDEEMAGKLAGRAHGNWNKAAEFGV